MALRKNGIYDFAKIAKERLKKNNYSGMEPQRSIDNAQSFTSYITAHKSPPVHKTIILPNQTSNEEFYKKVCQIIESGNTANPVSMLIDREVFNSLSVEDKQYYINSLNQKYKLYKDRYYKEHISSLYL